MLRIETHIDINASPERVWSVLTDFAAYPRWNPCIISVEGTPVVGGTLKARIQLPGGRPVSIRPRLLAFEPNRELRWIGGIPVPGLFSGTHYFVIEPRAGGGVGFLHGETFTGLLAPLLLRKMKSALIAGYSALNEALKQEAEKG